MIFFIGFIAGAVLASFIIWFFLRGKLFIVSESQFDFDETVERITRSAQENGWSIPNQYDLQATLEKHGYNVLPVKVFSVCQPGLAFQILGNNNERSVSALMPCRIAVYKTAGGKTYISQMNAGLFSILLGRKIRRVMKEAARGSERMLKPLIGKAAK